ncbi:MAG: hypothetical protein M0R70_10095 [Nitrospirae bacterium]|nr:hypothetical protein [Nitrospirota bacterium]
MNPIILVSILTLTFTLGTNTAMTEVFAGTGNPEQCNDGIDNNLDSLIDCADPDCANDSSCKVALNIKHSGSGRSSGASSCMKCHDRQKGTDAQNSGHLRGTTGGAPCVSW